MKYGFLCISLFACLALAGGVSGEHPDNLLFVANQLEHTVLLVDPISKQLLGTVGVDISGHEVAISPDGHFGYVPIYGNTWVVKSGSNGGTIHVVDLRAGRTVAVIDLGKDVRSHSAHFGPDGLLYVSAELANAIYIVDTKTRSLVGEIPTGASHTHMFVISPDGRKIYTANNEPGSVSILDLRARTLLATIPISKKVQRISISSDGKFIFTQDQETPRIVVIDTATNAVVRSIPVPRIVFSSIITNDGHWLLANSESGKLFVVDLASGAITKTFDVPDVPVLPTPGEFALAPDGTHAYVSCLGDGATITGPSVIGSGCVIESGAVVRECILADCTRVSSVAVLERKLVFGNKCIEPSGKYVDIDEAQIGWIVRDARHTGDLAEIEKVLFEEVQGLAAR